VWRSNDSGLTWILVNSAAPWSGRAAFKGLALNNNTILIWGTDMWRSSDGGVTWNQITSSPTGITPLSSMTKVLPNILI
jgi:photosystem II stability/assembly factor-like uncharacterized protein